MTTLFFAALAPILLLIIALSGLKLPAYQACTIALVSSFFIATQFFGMPYMDTVTAALWLPQATV